MLSKFIKWLSESDQAANHRTLNDWTINDITKPEAQHSLILKHCTHSVCCLEEHPQACLSWICLCVLHHTMTQLWRHADTSIQTPTQMYKKVNSDSEINAEAL